MGLDHWLDKVYSVADFFYNETEIDINIVVVDNDNNRHHLNIEKPYIREITESVCTWRKENWFHKFFLEQEGIIDDNCQPFRVSEATLDLLLDKIDKIFEPYKSGHVELAKQVAEQLLPPQTGFFFGSQSLDDDYFDSLERTKRAIVHARKSNRAFKSYFMYCASW